LAFLFLENDFVDDEKHNHGYAAVEDGGADVVQPGSHKVTGHSGPDAVDGVDNAGDHTEGQQVPQTLFQDIALTAEDPASLDEEVDEFSDEHGNHYNGPQEIDHIFQINREHGKINQRK